MFQWLHEYSSAISAVATALQIPIWIGYAHALYASFRRQRRPRLIINQIQGNGADSRCMLSNMSHEPLHIECLTVGLKSDKNASWRDLTHLMPGRSHDGGSRMETSADGSQPGEDGGEPHGPAAGGDRANAANPAHNGAAVGSAQASQNSDFMSHVPHGPLSSGSYRPLGSFERMLHQFDEEESKVAAWRTSSDLTLEIRAIGFYGPEDRPVGAQRRYRLRSDEDGRIRIAPFSVYTKQLTSRGQRKRLERELQKYAGDGQGFADGGEAAPASRTSSSGTAGSFPGLRRAARRLGGGEKAN